MHQVYLGSSVDCRPLLPRSNPCAAIFVDDFQGDARRLAAYLTYLSQNQSAYDSLRNWRSDFASLPHPPGQQSQRDGDGCGSDTLSPMFRKSWPCRLCEWAFHKANQIELSASTN